jgi:uncharacterized RDD family membrane protein YckC
MSDSDTLSGARESPEPSEPESSAAADAVTPLPDDLAASAGPPPNPSASVGPEDVLGLRIAAALIDLVLLGGLFVIMGTTVGGASVAGGSFDVSLNGAWLLAFLAVALVYYFALEAGGGRTVGKHVLGLRVSRAGERAPVMAVAVRTLLRVVDWLPLMYLAGFITMLATGARRQRVGDLVAGTCVTRVPVRHRGVALVPLAVVLLAAAGLSAYRVSSAGGTQSYRAHGVSFDYPAGWQEENLPASASPGSLWKTTFGPGTGADLIAVEAHQLSIPIGAGNLAEASSQLEPIVRRFFAQEGGAMQAGPQQITVGGLPGLRFRGTGTQQDGTFIGNTLLFAFNGTTEYAINCQHTRANAGEVERACGQVMRTFKASRPPPPPTGTLSYRAHGVSFAYPAALREGSLTGTAGNGPQLWAVSFALDAEDWIGIGADRLSAPVTAARLAAFTPAADKAARRFLGQAGGVVQAGPQQITVGGLPALQFLGALTTGGIAIKVTLVFAFHGTTQYFLYCAHTRPGAGQMERACAQVMRTFKVSKAT